VVEAMGVTGGLTADALSRLLGAEGSYGDFAYTYDAAGDRLSHTINGSPETYTYDTASHRLLETVDGGTRTYSYDAAGNTRDNTDRQFAYGDHNRLKAAQAAQTPVATYTYNGNGARVKKVATATTLYYYDQSGLLLAELDEEGTTQREYLYGDGQPVGMISGGAVYFIHVDHLGTPQVLTDGT